MMDWARLLASQPREAWAEVLTEAGVAPGERDPLLRLAEARQLARAGADDTGR